MRQCKKPVVASVHGHCIGGGVDLITCADIRICSRDATFSIRECAPFSLQPFLLSLRRGAVADEDRAKIGIVADLGTLQRIERIVGPGMAREMAFTADFIGADRALGCGLVNSVQADAAAVVAAGRKLAAEIAANSPLVVQGCKKVLDYAAEHSHEDGLMQIALWNTAFLRSDDLTEAVMAHMQKRTPKFRNRL